VAGSGSTAVGVLVGANVIVNDVNAVISGSTVTSHGALNVGAENNSDILAFTGGVAASGSTAVMVSMSGNVITNRTTAAIEESSTVIAGGAITLAATDASIINALAFGVAGSGSTAVGVGAAVNVIANDVNAAISDSQVTGASTLDLDAASSAGIYALAIGVAGSGSTAVQVTALGNAVSNRTKASISGSTVVAAEDIFLTAADEDPSLIPDWLVPAEYTQGFNDAIDGSPIDLSANIVAVNISVAASGSVAVNAALTGNVVANAVTTEISGSTVTSNAGDISLASDMSSGIISLTVGVAGSGSVAVSATGFGNVIANSTLATISDGSTVTATTGAVSLDAETSGLIRSAAVSVAGSGSVAVGALIGANVVTNTTASDIVSSDVITGTTLDLQAHNTSQILGLSVGVAASGSAAVLLSLTANVIADTTRASIQGTDLDRSFIDAGGAITLDASDASEINTVAVGVSGTGGGAVGVAMAANVITNSVETLVGDTDLESGSTLSLTSDSSAIIRALAVGVSASGGFAVQLTAMGNVVADTATAHIEDSVVTAAGDVTLTASDIAPSVVPFMDAVGDYVLDETTKSDLENALNNSPLDPGANILSVNVSVAGTGGVAVNGAFTGDVIANTVATEISDSTVTSTFGDIVLDSDSDTGIIALTVGVAGSGTVAVNATGFGNVIANSTTAMITDGSDVTATAGAVDLNAQDSSLIRSAAVSVAGTGAVAVGALIGANVVANTAASDIVSSSVTTGTTLDLYAANDADIMGLSVGVAASGAGAGLVSISANVIANTTRASIRGTVADPSDIDATGDVTLTALDTSEINTLAVGVAGTGGGAVGVGIASASIANSTVTEVSDTTLSTDGTLFMAAGSGSVIRTLGIGVAGSGAFAVQLTAMGNTITNTTRSEIIDATVTAGAVDLFAGEIAPSVVPFMDAVGGYVQDQETHDILSDALADSPLNPSANILALNVSVAGTGGVAVNGVITGNVMVNHP
jgi:hypothetical protein